jgi:ribosomal protein L13
VPETGDDFDIRVVLPRDYRSRQCGGHVVVVRAEKVKLFYRRPQRRLASRIQ